MALKKFEQTVCEAIDTMLRHKVALGLQDLPKDVQEEEEHSFQYLHEQINEMFAIKAAGLTHHDGACAAFRKVHNYKYITDPTFTRSVNEEMKAQGIPANECQQVLGYIPTIIDEVKTEDGWCERDAGYHPNLSEILKAGQGTVKKENRPTPPFNRSINEMAAYDLTGEIDRTRQFVRSGIEEYKLSPDYGPGNTAIFMPIEDLPVEEDAKGVRLYEVLQELTDEFEIEEEGGGFFFSEKELPPDMV